MSFGVRHVAPHLHTFTRANPEVTVDLSLNDRLVDLVEEGFDVAIRIARLADSSLISRRIADVHLVCVASPGYLANTARRLCRKTLPAIAPLAIRWTPIPANGGWRTPAADKWPFACSSTSPPTMAMP
jgi:DNA-binding transcriptional LysR family regulator